MDDTDEVDEGAVCGDCDEYVWDADELCEWCWCCDNCCRCD